jgi:hypothetical protein
MMSGLQQLMENQNIVWIFVMPKFNQAVLHALMLCFAFCPLPWVNLSNEATKDILAEFCFTQKAVLFSWYGKSNLFLGERENVHAASAHTSQIPNMSRNGMPVPIFYDINLVKFNIKNI